MPYVRNQMNKRKRTKTGADKDYSGPDGMSPDTVSRKWSAAGFDIIDDTYIVQIPSILKLKTEMEKLSEDKIDEDKLKLKSRFR